MAGSPSASKLGNWMRASEKVQEVKEVQEVGKLLSLSLFACVVGASVCMCACGCVLLRSDEMCAGAGAGAGAGADEVGSSRVCLCPTSARCWRQRQKEVDRQNLLLSRQQQPDAAERGVEVAVACIRGYCTYEVS